ncbi:hypothetical protein BURMUCGD2M_1410 [Burkholderia multivorans CGD2M]|uniref:Uncharacterized protein n=1 Tax=Burkholderia multivorans CGD2 TaxID=513052 RepID=B9BQ54_9BURK|nr:hypothetical protein BURMUCGD2_1317 [Burkholderia multivorans CGD2]EEE13309.1 hypothetical protein BURMUCGD2M_1410 [Burkholderia multivorans CGD2M]
MALSLARAVPLPIGRVESICAAARRVAAEDAAAPSNGGETAFRPECVPL